jgi:hypothetical protein
VAEPRPAWDRYDVGHCDGYGAGRKDGEAKVALWEPEPVVLPMRAAAQAVDVPAPVAQAVPESAPATGEALAAALAEHGTVRAAARALGVAESTFRSRAKRAGVVLPGRKPRS